MPHLMIQPLAHEATLQNGCSNYEYLDAGQTLHSPKQALLADSSRFPNKELIPYLISFLALSRYNLEALISSKI